MDGTCWVCFCCWHSPVYDMNFRIFWVRVMKCMCAQTRPRFILSSERAFWGMEFEPMLTPKAKSSCSQRTQPWQSVVCLQACSSSCLAWTLTWKWTFARCPLMCPHRRWVVVMLVMWWWWWWWWWECRERRGEGWWWWWWLAITWQSCTVLCFIST